ncbi:MAG: DegV family protein [Lachnospiraceae bacterium]|nr:DegV family protein [Lachnospiraceae bacterium]
MSIRIVGDSCLEFPDELSKSVTCLRVPLTITVEDKVIVDDETFIQSELLKAIEKSKHGAKSACPSPERFMQAYDGEEDWIFVITLSADLSGSYNSAMLAKNLFLEEHGDKKVYVFNSKSASGGEAQVALKIKELYDAGCSFEEIVEKTEEHIDDTRTYFVLESLEELRKNGRLSRLKAMAVNTLNLKPICAGDNGSIAQLGVARGMKKALSKMIEISLDSVGNTTKDRILIINYCNCEERAKEVLAEFTAEAEFKKTMLIPTAGISSLYAEDGGIIVTM